MEGSAARARPGIWRWYDAAVDKYRDLGLLILRLGFGLAFVWYHGLPKLMGGPAAWERTGDAMANIGITFAPMFWGLAAALSESLGGLLFAAGLFFRPVCVAMLTVMVMATIEQFGRPMPAPEHALKNAFVFAGMFLVGPGRYVVGKR
jgi:putative oxidoreductase